MPLDSTNNPKLRSFVEMPDDTPFSLQNLPYGIFRPRRGGTPRVGVAIGDRVLDLAAIAHAGLLESVPFDARVIFQASSLNPFMALGTTAWSAARTAISRLLRDDVQELRSNTLLRDAALPSRTQVELLLPVAIGDYTDFYSSREHATNVGIMFRGKDSALLPNWLHLPVGYHGRAGSIVVSGTPIRRPKGQTMPDGATAPQFGPTKGLDFELELGFFIGPGSEQGRPIRLAQAHESIFGMVLVNDWSARDIQRWEYQPLGPFLAKNFATSISPWVVTMQALEPFRVAGPKQEPEPLPYLRSRGDWNYDIRLEVDLQSERMDKPVTISETNARYLYWNVLQQLAHHTVAGCNVRTGDLMASGTISGPTPDTRGSLLELAWKGTEPVRLNDEESRVFLHDGDRVIFRGYAQGDGYRVGFGELSGAILPALPE